MKKSFIILVGFPVLAASLMIVGCAPIHCRDCYDCGAEIVIVPAPVPDPYPYPYPRPCPYPVPVYIEEPAPPPSRPAPLVKPRGTVEDTPRIKNPTGDRPGRKPVFVRGSSESEHPPEQIARSTPRRSSRSR